MQGFVCEFDGIVFRFDFFSYLLVRNSSYFDLSSIWEPFLALWEPYGCWVFFPNANNAFF